MDRLFPQYFAKNVKAFSKSRQDVSNHVTISASNHEVSLKIAGANIHKSPIYSTFFYLELMFEQIN